MCPMRKLSYNIVDDMTLGCQSTIIHTSVSGAATKPKAVTQRWPWHSTTITPPPHLSPFPSLLFLLTQA